jgi:hypothetical protein
MHNNSTIAFSPREHNKRNFPREMLVFWGVLQGIQLKLGNGDITANFQ